MARAVRVRQKFGERALELNGALDQRKPVGPYLGPGETRGRRCKCRDAARSLGELDRLPKVARPRAPVSAPALLRREQSEDLRAQLEIVTGLAERLLEERGAVRDVVDDKAEEP